MDDPMSVAHDVDGSGEPLQVDLAIDGQAVREGAFDFGVR
jgi:hypothetical protein